MSVTVCIVYSPSWAEHVKVEVHALRATNPGAKVYLLGDADGRLDLAGSEFLDAGALYRQRILSTVNVDTRFTKYALYRLLVPELLRDAPKVLYIDADAIVDGSLDWLWEHGLEGGALVAGVRDVGILPRQLRAIGLTVDDRYVNAGVTLLDLEGIRAADLHHVWLREINARHYGCHDQDIINLTCRGRINLVGNEWNSSLSTGFAPNPVIAHFAGPAHEKPWVDGARPYNVGIWKKWAAAADQDRERIPHVIHTSWFGGAPRPSLVQRCMESWQRVLPGWRVRVWDESNMNPILHGPPYVHAAYEARKWAFVSDWMRMRALFWEGGVYLDTDVELLAPLDEFLRHRVFTSHEADQWLLSATLGAEPGHPWIKMLLDYYLTARWDGGLEPNTRLVTRLSQPLVERRESGYTYLRDGVVVYPTEVFCPYDHVAMRPTPTAKSRTIHHFLGSWTPRGAVA